MFDVHPIGVVRSTLRAKAEAPNQAFEGAPPAALEIDPAFADALHLIEPGDELVVLTWLHLADRSVLQTHPRDDETIPLTLGGATTVHVDALEAIDGTPIIDLKVAMRESPDA